MIGDTKITDVYGDKMTVGTVWADDGSVVITSREKDAGVEGLATVVLSNKARKKLRRALKRNKP